jgi:hypothetical protein
VKNDNQGSECNTAFSEQMLAAAAVTRTLVRLRAVLILVGSSLKKSGTYGCSSHCQEANYHNAGKAIH